MYLLKASIKNFLKPRSYQVYLIIALLFCFEGCKIPTEHEVTIDTPETGMLSGKTTKPEIINNRLEWVGVSGVKVQVGNTGIVLESKTNGLFGADNIPTGVHNLVAKIGNEYLPNYLGEESVLITRQGVSDVTIKLWPNHRNYIVYGRIYEDKNGTIPLSNKYLLFRPTEGYTQYSTTTSQDGYYGFSNVDFAFWSKFELQVITGGWGYDVKDINTDEPYFPTNSVVIEANGYITIN